MNKKHTILVVIALLSIAFLAAQEVAQEAAAAAPTGGVNLVEIFKTSGWMAYPIVSVLLIGFILGFLRYMQLFVKEKIDADKFYLRLKNYVKNEQLDEAIKISEQFKGTTMGFIFWNGLLGFKDVK